MTPDQKKKLGEIGKQINQLFPDKYGNISFRFNLNPNRKEINMNIITEFSNKLQNP